MLALRNHHLNNQPLTKHPPKRGPADAAEHGLRFQQLRDVTLALPKWGSGNDQVNALGEWLLDHLVRICVSALDATSPHPALQPHLDAIKQHHADDPEAFAFVVTPGIGTFEGYVGDGALCGASADGRRNGSPLASDMSPSPSPQDQTPPAPRFRNIYQTMKSAKNHAAEYGLSNATPVDMVCRFSKLALLIFQRSQKYNRLWADETGVTTNRTLKNRFPSRT